jgi:hypothetical protein
VSFLPHLASLFIDPDVKQFAPDERGEALEWVGAAGY